jgi:VIT1/CCC1 family predicted Fe2+/Mn2+ transporter
MAAIAFTSGDARLPVTFLASLVALAITGGAGAYLGNSKILRPIARVTVGGGLALALTWGIGHLLGVGVSL